MSQKADFTDDEIEYFQAKADDYFSKWINLVGYDGVTNYVHMLGAGHIRYYLRKWRNLNRFQNQGWESYNKLVAAFWHHRTQKGGHGGERSKILPIRRWILRLMLWKTGVAQNFFSDLERSGELVTEADSEDDEELSKASGDMSDDDDDDESVGF